MELDQLIFSKIYKFYKNAVEKKDPALEARTANLEILKPRLTFLARALTGEPINIHPSEREGGWKDSSFLLPSKFQRCDSLENNIGYYIFRIYYLSFQKQLGLNWNVNEEHTVHESQFKAYKEAPKVIGALFEEFPLLEPLYAQLLITEKAIAEKAKKPNNIDFSWIYGRWMNNAHINSNEKDFNNSLTKEFRPNNVKPTTELKAKPVDEIKNIEINTKTLEDYCLYHNFEKIETADEFDGVWRELNGDDTLEEEQEALEELSLKYTIRVDDPAHSVYQAEFLSHGVAPDVKETKEENASYLYDEWDYEKRKYKEKYCKVSFNNFNKSSPLYVKETLSNNKGTLEELKKMFSSVNNKLEQISRQSFGEDIDIDAVTDNFARIYAGQSPSENIYLSKRKRRKDLSILILLDNSLSSDSYSNDHRIIDIEKQSVILFGEAAKEYEINFQIDCFNSRTRNLCRYNTIKSFKENWDTAKAKVGGIEPEGYTRIGPALRHAGALIEKEGTSKKWIMLLSDGKPNDYDKYEGRYGTEDVRQAIRELNAKNIYTFALAVESKARYYLPLMLGQDGYNILPQPSLLPLALGNFYKKVMKL